MNCKQAKEQFFDAIESGSPVERHIAGCAECASAWAALKSTMDLMDTWNAPEPSAYFNTRLRARLAEIKREEAVAATGWARFWKPAFLRPALVAAMGLAFVVGMSFYNPVAPTNETPAIAQKGTAVADLQALDRNHDLYDEFELLDEIGNSHAPHSSDQHGTEPQL